MSLHDCDKFLSGATLQTIHIWVRMEIERRCKPSRKWYVSKTEVLFHSESRRKLGEWMRSWTLIIWHAPVYHQVHHVTPLCRFSWTAWPDLKLSFVPGTSAESNPPNKSWRFSVCSTRRNRRAGSMTAKTTTRSTGRPESTGPSQSLSCLLLSPQEHLAENSSSRTSGGR